MSKLKQAVTSPHPKLAGRSRQERLDAVIDRPARDPACESAILEALQSASGSYPECAVIVLLDRYYLVIRQPVFRAEVAELPIFITVESAIS